MSDPAAASSTSPLITGLPGLPEDPAQRHELANAVSQRGIALLSAHDPAALVEALRCFETAIVLRRDLPVAENLWYRWGLCAGWMNRGDVLTRLGGAERLTEAVRSYDEALAHLACLPALAEPDVVGRHALAWMNRAITLRAQGTPESRAEALASLAHAERVLGNGAALERPVAGLQPAVLAVNRAALLMELEPPRLLDAMQAAEAALALAQPAETADPVAAETGLKARHVWCHAVAVLLETPPVDAKQADGWILHATDRVEEALTLATRWRQHGRAFKQLRLELFHYGCRIYLAYQPHFMAEFLLDVLDPERGSPLQAAAEEDLRRAAVEALEMAAEVLKRRGVLDFGLQGVDRLIEVLAGLADAAKKIKNLPSGV